MVLSVAIQILWAVLLLLSFWNDYMAQDLTLTMNFVCRCSLVLLQIWCSTLCLPRLPPYFGKASAVQRHLARQVLASDKLQCVTSSSLQVHKAGIKSLKYKMTVRRSENVFDQKANRSILFRRSHHGQGQGGDFSVHSTAKSILRPSFFVRNTLTNDLKSQTQTWKCQILKQGFTCDLSWWWMYRSFLPGQKRYNIHDSSNSYERGAFWVWKALNRTGTIRYWRRASPIRTHTIFWPTCTHFTSFQRFFCSAQAWSLAIS